MTRRKTERRRPQCAACGRPRRTLVAGKTVCRPCHSETLQDRVNPQGWGQ